MGSCFEYQVAASDVVVWVAYSLFANSVTSENRPSKAGETRRRRLTRAANLPSL